MEMAPVTIEYTTLQASLSKLGRLAGRVEVVRPGLACRTELGWASSGVAVEVEDLWSRQVAAIGLVPTVANSLKKKL